jgi:uncharacterized protein (DUF302 family)
MTAQGLKVLESRHDQQETLKRIEGAIARYGMTVFARVDHGAAAEKAGMELRPTVVLLFGSPRAGTPLMHQTPTLAIDLPIRMLVWQDADGVTRLAYNDPAWLLSRHGARDDGSIQPMIAALAAVASEAAR